MQTKILSLSRYVDKETGELSNFYYVYTNSKEIASLRMYKSGLKEIESNSFKVFDSYLESCIRDAINSLREYRVYADLLNNAVDKDSIINLLISNATIELDVEKIDSENENNELGYYYKYNIQNIVLDIDEFNKVTIFEVYRNTFQTSSEAYLRFVSKLLGVENVFYS